MVAVANIVAAGAAKPSSERLCCRQRTHGAASQMHCVGNGGFGMVVFYIRDFDGNGGGYTWWEWRRLFVMEMVVAG